MLLSRGCPFCGDISQIEVDEDSYEEWASGLANIQDAFPDLDTFGRELIKTGICYNCQERTFHKPLPYHAKAWGELIGECIVCGCGIYENEDKLHDNVYRCSSCNTKMNLEDLQSEGSDE